MNKVKTIDGNEACAKTSYLFTEVAGIYPITPSSPMAEHIDEWSNEGKLNAFNDTVKVVEMQSEAGAAGLVHGSLSTGLLTSTYTASQGLLLMIPNMYKIAGEMLPCTMHVAARSLSTHALSIFGDHQDIYATRMTGFAMLASSSVQDASLLSAVAHLSSIKSSIPFMHFFDGFRTSHEINKIEVIEDEDLIKLIDKESLNKFRNKSLNPSNPNTRGTAENDDIYFQNTEARNIYYDKLPLIVSNYMREINKLAGTSYAPFNYYGDTTAKKIIIAMGSVCETIKETIDYLNKTGEKLGLVEVHLYRPLSSEYLIKEIPQSVEKIAVLDRTKENGSIGEPLYLDIVSALNQYKDSIKIVGGRYGLSSKNTTPSDIKAVYDMLDKPEHNFTIGINDDVTHLSLKKDESFKISNSLEFLIYGYGSDGMVSASKSIIKLVGDNTPKYVQGYFQYDSKKSGGVTISHMRFNDSKIRSTYYVEKPKLIVCTKESYLNDFDVINNIEKDGIFILNTNKNKTEIESYLTEEVKAIIKTRNIKFYIINAYELSNKLGLKNKISIIMETVILYLSNVMDFNESKIKLVDYINEKFGKKSSEIINANIASIEEAVKYLEEVIIMDDDFDIVKNKLETEFKLSLIGRRGDNLPVSAFIDYKDGVFTNSSNLEKKGISDSVPKYNNETCIQCGICSLVCPHSVIRNFLLSEEEYKIAPDYVKVNAKKAVGYEGYFIVANSILDCTGCGLCIKNCPTKSLSFESQIEQYKNKEQERFDYLEKNITEKDIFKIDTIKGSQLKKPKFEFCGACAGCGETPYIKLLTQLMGDKLVIANATGCSSIYGGSSNSLPYTIPWASSLFEDNAEFGYGMLIAYSVMKNRIKNIMENNMDNVNGPLYKEYLDNIDDYKITSHVYDSINYKKQEELIPLKEYIKARSIWTIGGDGWAYDIGFGGIDHVLASNDNVNILVLDSEVYSNTGGQASKATAIGGIASFASKGKKTSRKDLAKIALTYPNVYVATISLGSNFMNTIKVLKEASEYDGPSIVIAYSPCIEHGIKGGLSNSIDEEKLATACGYFPTFNYNPKTKQFTLNSKNVDFNLYEEFLNRESRYAALKKVNPDYYKELLEENKLEAIARFEYYKNLELTNKAVI